MKKLALTSLLAVFAISGANAANIIDGNPLYMPKAGHFYSVTDLGSHSEFTKNWTLGEEFGYGVSDKLAISVSTSLAEEAEDPGEDEMFDRYGWENLGINATYRAFQDGNLVADVYGAYTADGHLFAHSDGMDDSWWFDKRLVGYRWTAGVRGGYTSAQFTIAGHIAYEYFNGESFNWGDYGEHSLKLGVDGQFVIDQNWNLVGGAEYTGITNDKVATYTDVKGVLDVEDAGVWTYYFGANYNIDATKFVGAYVNGRAAHATGDWEADDGFGFGFKFGIDF